MSLAGMCVAIFLSALILYVGGMYLNTLSAATALIKKGYNCVINSQYVMIFLPSTDNAFAWEMNIQTNKTAMLIEMYDSLPGNIMCQNPDGIPSYIHAADFPGVTPANNLPPLPINGIGRIPLNIS